MDPSPRRTVYGLLRVRGMALALPLGLLREVVPAPAAYQPVPLCAPGLLGTFVLRDQIVPVVDLRSRLDGASGEGHGAAVEDGDSSPGTGARAGAGSGQGHVVAVLVHAGAVLGLLADDVRGVETVADGDLQRLSVHDGERPLVASCFTHGLDRTVTGVLDGDAVFTLPGVPTAEIRTAAGPATTADTTGTGSLAATMLLFQVGAALCAIDADPVATVLPTLDLERSVLDGDVCRGTVRHLDLAVPVVDPLVLTGLGALDPAARHQGIVLHLPRGYVVLAVDAVHAVTRVALDDVRPLPALAAGRTDRFRGVHTAGDGRHYLVLDHDRLRDDADLDALSALNTDHHAAGTGADGADRGRVTDGVGAARAGGTYLTYDIGTPVATPLDQVREILALPADRVTTSAGHGGADAVASFVHRGETVPLIDLAALLRPALCKPADAGTRVLLVRGASGTVGFAVAGLRALERSSWESAPDECGDPTAGDRLGAAPLLQLVGDATHALIPRVDLVTLLAALSSAPEPGPADGTDPASPDGGDAADRAARSDPTPAGAVS